MVIVVVVSGCVIAVCLWVFVVEPLWLLPLLERVTPNILYRVRTEKPLVALSFDDGPHPEFTEQVLDALRPYGAKATFFLIGERASQYPYVVSRIRAEGHEIGNHYFQDGSLLGHSKEKFMKKLHQTESAIQSALMKRGLPSEAFWQERMVKLRFFRPPGGVAWPWQLRLVRELGYTCVLGCAYPHDPARPPVWYIRWLISKNLKPGTILILHDGIKDATRGIAALPDILEEGERRGLKFVSIATLVDETEAGSAEA